MSKFNYLKINRTIKIRYLKYNQKNTSFIVFLHGFMSDLEGKKPKAFLNFAKKNKLGFLALEYSGHGKSSGKFTNGNISKWTKETTILIKKIVKKNRIILIGSSMGSWISLNQFKFFKKQIVGFLGIGSAPQFLEELMWKKFSKKMKREITKNGIINLKQGNYEYPISLQLIKDGQKNKVFNKKIYDKLKVTMVHGQKDESVPVRFSKKILKIFVNSKKKLVIVRNGDHSLSSTKWLNILKKELKNIIS
ncbi:alpha/beta hydrolase [Pelagibacterales bacterium SAG-MED38]|nr:alpha/beta hydrolase [Pelagibacterales bacterium SAG-MED38]|tara:strand:+ start:205 stop:951 length:747 start_codon:yes stop_codon:yes gene_type:complete